MERCLAKRAVYIGSLMIVAERMRDKTDRADQWTTFVRLGERYRDRYLEVAHGDPDGLRDSATTFAAFRKTADAWEARALSLARRLRFEDQEWHATWPGPSYRTSTTLPGAEASTEPTPFAALTAEPCDIAGHEPERSRPTDGAVPPRDSPTRDRAWEPVPVRRRSVASAPPNQRETAVPAVRSCIFCHRPANAVEYLWSEWLCRAFVDRVANASIERGRRDSLVDRLRREVDQTVDVVCRACARGWMQHLDDDVIAFLPAMIAGDQTRLSPRQQGLLAQWGARTAAVHEGLYGEPVPALRAAYSGLADGDLHPGTQVLVGAYNGDGRLLTRDRDVFRRTVGEAEHYLPQSTFVIGAVFIQVFVDPWLNGAPEPAEETSRLLIALMPRRRRVDWPPAAPIDDALYDLARRGELEDHGDTADAARSITA